MKKLMLLLPLLALVSCARKSPLAASPSPLPVRDVWQGEDGKLNRQKVVSAGGRDIYLYQADYSRNDLHFVCGLTSDGENYNCTWKIGGELIEV